MKISYIQNRSGWGKISIREYKAGSINIARKEGDHWFINKMGFQEFSSDLLEQLIEFVEKSDIPHKQQLMKILIDGI